MLINIKFWVSLGILFFYLFLSESNRIFLQIFQYFSCLKNDIRTNAIYHLLF